MLPLIREHFLYDGKADVITIQTTTIPEGMTLGINFCAIPCNSIGILSSRIQPILIPNAAGVLVYPVEKAFFQFVKCCPTAARRSQSLPTRIPVCQLRAYSQASRIFMSIPKPPLYQASLTLVEAPGFAA